MVFLSLLGLISILLNSVLASNRDMEIFTYINENVLFDFTKNDNTEGWIEQSDTVREVGMSKAVFSIQKTQIFKRAILFTLLNPQPNGACFAGIRKITHLNLGSYNSISLRLRGQGQNMNYKVVLRHKNMNDEPNPTYEQFFTAPITFDTIILPLDNFTPYYRGKPVNDTEKLDKTKISCIGIQMYGGVYLPTKQYGASSLEIDWIKATE